MINKTQGLALFAALLICSSCRESVAEQVEKDYKLLTLSSTDAVVGTRYSTSIRGEQFVDIRPQISGVITDIKIEEGAKVSKGQTLFVIDQVAYQAALDVAVAGVKSAESAVATAQLNLDSAEALYRAEVISQNELQTTRNALLSAQAALSLAQAQENIARNDLSYTLVKSPVDGVASMINYRVGALVSSSIDTPLVSVSNNNQMYAYFSISESALLTMVEQSGSTDKLIEDMSQIELVLSNGKKYAHTGRVDAISGVVEQSTGSVSVRAIFDNPEQMLRDGGNGALLIATTYEDVIVVPKVATYEIQNKKFVYKVIDGKTSSAQITVQPTDNGQEYIVLSGVAVGDVLIAEGAGLLREGLSVKVK